MKDASRHPKPISTDARSALEAFVRALARAAARDVLASGIAMTNDASGESSDTAEGIVRHEG